LDISKIEVGKLEIAKADYSFSAVISDVITIIQTRVVNTGLLFTANIDSRIPDSLYGDGARLRQVLINILNNAVKYTQKGHISLDVGGTVTNDGKVVLSMSVTDTGIGIKPEDLDKLFGEFTQFDTEKNKGIEGSGLGLAITKKIVNTMDGDISVRSVYGSGSTFTVTLPQEVVNETRTAHVEDADKKSVLVYMLHELYTRSIIKTLQNMDVPCTGVSAEAELHAELSENSYTHAFIDADLYENINDIQTTAEIILINHFGEKVPSHVLRNITIPVYAVTAANTINGVASAFAERKGALVGFTAPDANILVVDDINTNLTVAQGLLKPYEANVTLCRSGFEALEAIKRTPFDVIFMDHMMPEMDGVETSNRIREVETYENVPIIVLTANAMYGTREMFIAYGFDEYLSKPIDVERLNSVLERWLPKHKRIIKQQEESPVTVSPGEYEAIQIPGLDTKKGMSATGGYDNYLRVLRIFLRDAAEKTEEIKTCLETGNISLYTTHIHALKSASANIGAFELAETAKALEDAGRDNDTAFITANNPVLAQSLHVLTACIADVLNALKPEGETDTAALHGLLANLGAALDSFDAREIKNAAKELQPHAGMREVDDILQSVLIGDYEEALAMIAAFSETLAG
jgi:CheY-like chemotaxis protein/HPt (histidine-containing phosphotransfer) domain-containing protein